MSETPAIPITRPTVAAAGRGLPPLLGYAAMTVLGIAVFTGLDSRREAHAQGISDGMTTSTGLSSAPPQPLPAIPQPPATPPPVQPLPVVQAMPAIVPPAPAAETAEDAARRRSAPALIVDLSDPQARRLQLAQAESGTAAAVPPVGAAPRTSQNDTERFASRVAAEKPEAVGATFMGSLDRIVPQGATIEAVMETAIDSDLPGYARAVISRDVLSFDGSATLIPRGSTVIGQYKSGVAQGASRVFVIWSRVIRPDGVSVMLASPATDELGRGGLGGKVDRHFLQRFGGAILLSVIDGGIAAGTAALTSSTGTGVFIGSATQATSVATEALRSTDLPPTIRTKQGAGVRIFVARDLDFSAVGPAR